MAKFPLSVRGKNLAFLEKIADRLYLDSDGKPKSLAEFKKGFTAGAVRDLHEEVIRLWPKTMNIEETLKTERNEVSGFYIGDYSPDNLIPAIVRHSLYAGKLLIADPFMYAHSVRDKYNPILNPEQYRTQTLRNVNLWLQLAPWIKAGIVEVIRTPDDFDHKLAWDSMKEQEEKFKNSPELQEALEISREELESRHIEKWRYRDLFLSMPDDALLRRLEELEDRSKGITKEGLLEYVHEQRQNDPDFLMVASSTGQMGTITSGASYNIARLTASLTSSYLVTDLTAKWKEIELDRPGRSEQTEVWSPFAKAIQETQFKYLNAVTTDDAFRVRSDGRLDDLRAFLRRVWKQACDPQSFSKVNGGLLADELKAEMAKADAEWKKIDHDLTTNTGAVGAGLIAAGPMIGTGNGIFLAAAAMVGGMAALVSAAGRRKAFRSTSPAAFFLRL